MATYRCRGRALTVYLGDDAFVESMQARLSDEIPLSEIPATQHRPPPKSLDHYAKVNRDRDKTIAAAYRSGGYSMKAIGDHFGLGYSMVSRIIKRMGDLTPFPVTPFPEDRPPRF